MEQQSTSVLLIEDNPGDADLVRLRLVESDPPVQVDCVHRLADALKALGRKMPALVLLDLNLPDSHGAETFRRVMEKAPNVPIVILSGQDDENLAMKAVHLGVQDYLIKNDITSKQLDRALRYAIERQSLLRSLEMTRKQQLEFKSQFLSHVSHELRTPLTCIHQYVTLLLDGLAGPLTGEQTGHLRTVLKGVTQLHSMIRDLLEATRAETGKLRIEPRCVSIGDLVGQAVAMMQPAANEKAISLSTTLDPAIPLVYADPERILEVLTNLLDNGLKFNRTGGAISIKASMVDTDPSAVYVSVSDTGCGISPQALPRIFERLFQDTEHGSGNHQGLGLGLYIAREIVNLHGGRMWAASEQGSGSTFSFHLPVYSLPRLLAPVAVDDGQLRPSFVLVRVDLRPLKTPPSPNWKDLCQQGLETLRRCVYVDKDLVLPPVAGSNAAETFFVIASTDVERAAIMTGRIRDQLKVIPGLGACASVHVRAASLGWESAQSPLTIEQQVQALARRVTDSIMASMAELQTN